MLTAITRQCKISDQNGQHTVTEPYNKGGDGSTAGERKPHDKEDMDSNPAECWAFFSPPSYLSDECLPQQVLQEV